MFIFWSLFWHLLLGIGDYIVVNDDDDIDTGYDDDDEDYDYYDDDDYDDDDDAGTSDKSILRRASLFSHRPSVFSIQVMMRCWWW